MPAFLVGQTRNLYCTRSTRTKRDLAAPAQTTLQYSKMERTWSSIPSQGKGTAAFVFVLYLFTALIGLGCSLSVSVCVSVHCGKWCRTALTSSRSSGLSTKRPGQTAPLIGAGALPPSESAPMAVSSTVLDTRDGL